MCLHSHGAHPGLAVCTHLPIKIVAVQSWERLEISPYDSGCVPWRERESFPIQSGVRRITAYPRTDCRCSANVMTNPPETITNPGLFIETRLKKWIPRLPVGKMTVHYGMDYNRTSVRFPSASYCTSKSDTTIELIGVRWNKKTPDLSRATRVFSHNWGWLYCWKQVNDTQSLFIKTTTLINALALSAVKSLCV